MLISEQIILLCFHYIDGLDRGFGPGFLTKSSSIGDGEDGEDVKFHHDSSCLIVLFVLKEFDCFLWERVGKIERR